VLAVPIPAFGAFERRAAEGDIAHPARASSAAMVNAPTQS
jgi:hypothetical protein